MSFVLLRRRFGLGSLQLFSHQCTFVANYNKAADLTGRLAVRTYKYLTTSHLQPSASPAQIKLHTSHLMLLNRATHRRAENYAWVAPLVFAVSFGVAGIGIGPPGEFSFFAVKTSTPVSVTNKVCSRHLLAFGNRRLAK